MRADDRNVSSDELDRCLQQFLLPYRVIPHATTGRAPAELFLNRKLTTMLDRMRINLKNQLEKRVETQQRQRQEKGREPDFGDRVYARFWYGSRLLRKAIIETLAGPLSYDIQVNCELHRCHAAQLIHDRVGADLIGKVVVSTRFRVCYLSLKKKLPPLSFSCCSLLYRLHLRSLQPRHLRLFRIKLCPLPRRL